MKTGIIKDFSLPNNYITDSINLYNTLRDYYNKYPSENTVTFDASGYSNLESLKNTLKKIIYGVKED